MLACSLTHLEKVFVLDMNASISKSFNPLWAGGWGLGDGGLVSFYESQGKEEEEEREGGVTIRNRKRRNNEDKRRMKLMEQISSHFPKSLGAKC